MPMVPKLRNFSPDVEYPNIQKYEHREILVQIISVSGIQTVFAMKRTLIAEIVKLSVTVFPVERLQNQGSTKQK